MEIENWRRELAGKFATKDHDRLADLIWWLHGYMDALRVTCMSSPLGAEHVEALRKARILLGGLIGKDGE